MTVSSMARLGHLEQEEEHGRGRARGVVRLMGAVGCRWLPSVAIGCALWRLCGGSPSCFLVSTAQTCSLGSNQSACPVLCSETKARVLQQQMESKSRSVIMGGANVLASLTVAGVLSRRRDYQFTDISSPSLSTENRPAFPSSSSRVHRRSASLLMWDSSVSARCWKADDGDGQAGGGRHRRRHPRPTAQPAHERCCHTPPMPAAHIVDTLHARQCRMSGWKQFSTHTSC